MVDTVRERNSFSRIPFVVESHYVRLFLRGIIRGGILKAPANCREHGLQRRLRLLDFLTVAS